MLTASLVLLSALLADRSPEVLFARFVAAPVPASIREINCWYYSGFGYQRWAFSFRIAPDDFDQILVRYPYQMQSDPDGLEIWDLKQLIRWRKACPLCYPQEPMVVSYRHDMASPDGGLHVVVYSNRSRDVVYVLGGYE